MKGVFASDRREWEMAMGEIDKARVYAKRSEEKSSIFSREKNGEFSYRRNLKGNPVSLSVRGFIIELWKI